MRFLIISLMLLLTASCGSVKSKGSKFLLNQVVKKVKDPAKEHLKCKTGDAVADSLRTQIEKVLKIQKSLAQSASNLHIVDAEKANAIGGEVCSQLVAVALPYLIDFGSKGLPDTWKEDGCTLDGLSTTAMDLAKTLCGKI